ncbi:hypothetical protein chiPu_0017905 [Chiloscyllium punctatum]|uniref:Uncharacterized protein n=1 Tax=Chiloscyllium punctatum TaxID=137246 RepID=A0A401RJQ3_CHIPU|nr:hypothetical protein [Chiloscyllium punctatum]
MPDILTAPDILFISLGTDSLDTTGLSTLISCRYPSRAESFISLAHGALATAVTRDLSVGQAPQRGSKKHRRRSSTLSGTEAFDLLAFKRDVN